MKFLRIFFIFLFGIFYSSLSLAETVAYFPQGESFKQKDSRNYPKTKEAVLEENLYHLASPHSSDISASADNQRIYQIDRKKNVLRVSNFSNNKNEKETSIKLDRLPIAVVAHPFFPIAYLLTAPKGSETQGALYTVGLQNEKYQILGDPILLGKFPTAIILSPDGKRIYVTHTDEIQNEKTSKFEGALFVFEVGMNPHQLTLISSSEIPNHPTGIAVAPDHRAVYLIEQGEEGGILSAVQTNSFRIISQVEVGDDPYALSVSPDGNFVYVAHSGKKQLAVVDVSSHPIQKVLDISLGNSPIVFGKFNEVSSPMR